MSDYYQTGEAIDGHRVELKIKKYLPKGLTSAPTGFKGVKYKCSRSCYATIIHEHTGDTKTDLQKNHASVHIASGDMLQCDKLYFVAETKRNLNCFSVTMMSGQHECSCGAPDVRVYAEIETPFSQIINVLSKHPELQDQPKAKQLTEETSVNS